MTEFFAFTLTQEAIADWLKITFSQNLKTDNNKTDKLFIRALIALLKNYINTVNELLNS